MAGPVHSTFRDHDVACLQDPDFWRYLALFPLRWYTIAREPELKPQSFGGLTKSASSSSSFAGARRTDMKKQAVFRTYLWGKAAFDASASDADDPYERTTALSDVTGGPSAIDVWHSHIVRPQIGHLGNIPHAFIDVVSSEPLPTTDEARELAKLLTRMKHTVALDTYEYEGAVQLVKDQLEFAKQRLANKQ